MWTMDDLKTLAVGAVFVAAVMVVVLAICSACVYVPYFGLAMLILFGAFLFVFACYAVGLVYRGML